MKKKTAEILTEVAQYYTAKLQEHGETPHGVDWNGEASQTLRFAQLCKIVTHTEGFSLNDLGCGYGALYDYLAERYHNIRYTGCDVSAEMVRAAQIRYAARTGARFVVASAPPEIADYTVASGIFNVRLGRNDVEWREYLDATLETMFATSRYGFAFNCLTAYSDADKKRDYLYYADPCALFDYCKRRFSRQVALLHDYGLYEFTLLVRREL